MNPDSRKTTVPSTTTPEEPVAAQSASDPAALLDEELAKVAGGLSLLKGDAVLPLAPAEDLLNLGKLDTVKGLEVQLRPGGVLPVDHQSRDMD